MEIRINFRISKRKKYITKRANSISHHTCTCTHTYAPSPREFVHERDPRSRWVLAPDRTLIICQLAHSRLRTRDTSIYRATNISIRVVFAKAVLDLFILGRSLHRPRGWFIILVRRRIPLRWRRVGVYTRRFRNTELWSHISPHWNLKSKKIKFF